MATRLESHIQGIPCQIQIETYRNVAGSHSYDAPSDADFYGYVEIEFSVFDRKGYPAAWLERKLTANDRDRIEQQIIDWKED